MLGRLIGAPRHWFSDLQWDLEEPSGSRQPLRPASGLGPALQSKRDLAVKSTSQDTEHPHPERPQEDWAQRSFSEAGVLTAHSQSEEPRLRPQLSEDGTLDAAQPVRFVAEGGNHRSVAHTDSTDYLHNNMQLCAGSTRWPLLSRTKVRSKIESVVQLLYLQICMHQE